MWKPILMMACALVVVAGCSSTPQEVDQDVPAVVEETSTTQAAIEHPNNSSDVVVQVGSYQYDWEGQHVYGPEFIIYGDGSVYTSAAGRAPDGLTRFEQVTGDFETAEVQSLLRAALDLPDESAVGLEPMDGLPLEVHVNGQEWVIFDLTSEPFVSYLETVRAAVDGLDATPWVPDLWIERIPPGNSCTVVSAPTQLDASSVPVFPHLADGDPLTEINCA